MQFVKKEHVFAPSFFIERTRMYRAFLIPLFVALMPMLLFFLVVAKLIFPRVIVVKWASIFGMLAIDIFVILLITLN